MNNTKFVKHYTLIVAIFVILIVAVIMIFIFVGQLNRNTAIELSAGVMRDQKSLSDYSWSNTKMEQVVVIAPVPVVQQIVSVEE